MERFCGVVGKNEIIEVVERLGVKPRDEVVNAAVRLYRVRRKRLFIVPLDTGAVAAGSGAQISDVIMRERWVVSELSMLWRGGWGCPID